MACARRRAAYAEAEAATIIALERWALMMVSLSLTLIIFFLFLISRSSPDSLRAKSVIGSVTKRFPLPRYSFSGEGNGGPRVEAPTLELHEGPPAEEDDAIRSAKENAALEQFARLYGGSISVEKEALLLRLPSEGVFAPGDDTVSVSSMVDLRDLARKLRTARYSFSIEGHTDSLPMRSGRFPSNWELSMARATSVLHVFLEEGIAPDRLRAIGRAEFAPIAQNGTAEGRAKNRRIDIVLTGEGNLR